MQTMLISILADLPTLQTQFSDYRPLMEEPTPWPFASVTDTDSIASDHPLLQMTAVRDQHNIPLATLSC